MLTENSVRQLPTTVSTMVTSAAGGEVLGAEGLSRPGQGQARHKMLTRPRRTTTMRARARGAIEARVLASIILQRTIKPPLHNTADTACRVSNRSTACVEQSKRRSSQFSYLRSPFSTLSPFGCCRCAALQCRRAASAEEGSCPQGGPPPVSPSPSAKLRLAACFRTHQRLAKKKHRLRRRGAQTIQAWLHNRCVLLQAIIQLDASNVRQLMNKQFGWSLT